MLNSTFEKWVLVELAIKNTVPSWVRVKNVLLEKGADSDWLIGFNERAHQNWSIVFLLAVFYCSKTLGGNTESKCQSEIN